MKTVSELLHYGSSVLGAVSDTPRLDADVLLSFVLEVDRLVLIRDSDSVCDAEVEGRFRALIERRLRCEPVAYLVGQKEFYGLVFKVTPDVLIPRPDTELLVEVSLDIVRARSRQTLRIIDCGTGSGCIAVSLAFELNKISQQSVIHAIDQSESALRIAQENSNALLGRDSHVKFYCSSWFEDIPVNQRYDLIISNPPYLEPEDPALGEELQFEPPRALYSDNNGLSDISLLLDSLDARLHPGGTFLCECGYRQAPSLLDLACQLGPEYKSEFLLDYAGIQRVLRVDKGI